MNRNSTMSRWLIATLMLAVAVFAATRLASAAPTQRALQQAPSCTWTKIGGNLPQQVFHGASAYDTKNNHIYIYGGLDRNNSVQSAVQRIDVSDADTTKATSARVTSSGALQRYGAAGAFRPEGESGKIYWIGGADTDGQGNNDVQVMDLSGGFTKANISGGLNRVFHAAAYDPEHDVIVVHGGAKTCGLVDRTPPATPTPKPTSVAFGGSSPAKVNDVEQASPCQGDASLRTQYLSWASDGTMSWVTGPSGGPSQVFGLSLTYDPVGKRMIAFGGTTGETSNPNRDVWALDLSDPMLAKANWTKLNTAGSGPAARSFQAASFDASKNWFVVTGGVASDLFKATENVRNDTYALNMGANPPMWSDLKTSSGERMGATSAYAVPGMGVTVSGGRKQYKFTGQNTLADTSILKCSVPTAGPPTNTPGGPTTKPPTPGGGTTNPPTAVPTIATGKICDQIKNRVPAAALNAMVAQTPPMKGCNSSLPIGPNNAIRSYVSLENIAKPYHPLFNGLTFKCGCP